MQKSRKPQEIVAVIGYGSQSRAIALNLRDSGYSVTVGLRGKSKSLAEARREGLVASRIEDAIKNAAIIIIAIPDHCHANLLDAKFFEKLSGNPALVFLHGTSIHFKLVAPPKHLQVLLLAPHAPGMAVRENYLNKTPFSAFIAIHQGDKKRGLNRLGRLAKGIGIPSKHLVKTTFADEAIGDLFGEQAVLCGGMGRLLKFGFETLVEAGIPPANAYLEVAYQLDLIVALVKQCGLSGMFERISPMARYGSARNGPRVIGPEVRRAMKKLQYEIESGEFIRTAIKSGLEVSSKEMAALTNRAFDRQAKKFSRKS